MAQWLLQGGLAPAPLHPLTPGATGCGVLPVVCGARRRGIAANYFLISPLFCGKIKKFFAAGFRTRGGHLLPSATNFFPRTPIFPVGGADCGGDSLGFFGWFCFFWRTLVLPCGMLIVLASIVILASLLRHRNYRESLSLRRTKRQTCQTCPTGPTQAPPRRCPRANAVIQSLCCCGTSLRFICSSVMPQKRA